MDKKGIHNNFNGYSAVPLAEADHIIRARLVELFDRLIKKNKICLDKARDHWMEKIYSRILTIQKRMDRIKGEMKQNDKPAAYRLENLKQEDESDIRSLDIELENTIEDCAEKIDSLTCMETDVHIYNTFSDIERNLRKIEEHFHKRKEIFKKMRIFG